MNMKLLLTLSLIITTTQVLANEEVEYKTMEQMMGSIRLEKKQVESMVDKLIASGRISAEDGMKAKRELASLKESDMESLKAHALAEVKSKKIEH